MVFAEHEFLHKKQILPEAHGLLPNCKNRRLAGSLQIKKIVGRLFY